MKFLQATNDFWPSPGGIQSWAVALAQGGVPTLAIAERIDKVDFSELSLGNDVLLGENRRPKSSRPKDLFWMMRQIRKLPPDVNPIAMQVSSAGLACMATGRRYGVIVHGNEFLRPLDRSLHRSLVQRVLSRAQVVFCNSAYTKRLLHIFYSGEIRAVVMHPRVQSHFSSLAETWQGAGSQTVTMVGSLAPRKNHKMMIEVMSRLPSSWTLHVLGSGADEEWAFLADACLPENVRGRVRITKSPDANQIVKAFQESAVTVMPAQSHVADRDVEGFGIVSLESQIIGIPTLVADSGGLPETGAAVVKGNAQDWADKILGARSNPHPGKMVWRRFGPHGVKRELEELWNSVRLS